MLSERWPSLFLFLSLVVSQCLSLSVDETLRPKDSYVIINRNDGVDIPETIGEHFIQKRSVDPIPHITNHVSVL